MSFGEQSCLHQKGLAPEQRLLQRRSHHGTQRGSGEVGEIIIASVTTRQTIAPRKTPTANYDHFYCQAVQEGKQLWSSCSRVVRLVSGPVGTHLPRHANWCRSTVPCAIWCQQKVPSGTKEYQGVAVFGADK